LGRVGLRRAAVLGARVGAGRGGGHLCSPSSVRLCPGAVGCVRAASDAMPPHLALHGHARSSVLVAPARLALGALPQAPARMRRLSACSPMPLWRAAPSWLLVAQPPW